MGCSGTRSARSTQEEQPRKVGSPVKAAKAAATRGAPSDSSGDSDGFSDDDETFEEMKALVVTACDGAIKSSEWRLKGAWSELDKNLRSSSISDMAPVRAAARFRDTKLLAEEVGRAGTAGTAAQHVLTSSQLLQLRRGIFAAALGSNAVVLARLLDAAESLGENCDLERDFVTELRERSGGAVPDPIGDASAPPPPPSIAPPACGGIEPPPQHSGVPNVAKAKKMPRIESPSDKHAQTAKRSFPASQRHEDLVTLGLDEGADVPPTAEKIRIAYRQAALRWHPDRPHNAGVPNAAEKFRLAREAYERLRDHPEGMN